MCTIKKFDAETATLEGKNLIEASAGTGKTYSIALLVLRLIIEKKIPVEKILMVTFTKAAVAELESRIRKFVRLAFKYSLHQNIDNPKIRKIIDEAGKGRSSIELRKAVQTLDQLSVMTIHSFCEDCLVQYPFETNQSFSFELVSDISEIREMVVNEYWRKNIATLEKGIYRHLSETLSRKVVQDVLKKALDDKEYICDDINENEILNEISEFINKAESSKLAFENHIINNFENIKSYKVTGHALSFLNNNCSSPLIFINAYKEGYKKGTQYIQNSFPDEYRLYNTYVEDKNNLDGLTSQYIYYSFKLAIDKLKEKITGHKSNRNLIDFYDQINLLNRAVKVGHANRAISSRYEAVFIDEFQDTDKLQYEIFSKLFSDKIIFYIGDPKQSIYGWRKADIETYKSAKAEVDTVYSMNLNFRSTKELIEQLNSFFSIDNPFADDQIEYKKVATGDQELGYLTNANDKCDSFEIYGFKNKSEIKNFTICEIKRLLSLEEIKVNGESLKPSDIAVIVRTNSEGKEFKEALSDINIPAITIDDANVMSSEETKIIQNFMGAVIQPNRSAINKVLLNPCFGMNSELIRKLDDEKHLEQFRELKTIWLNSGIYNALFRFFDYYKVRQYGIKMGIGGQRILTNLYQIAEILHQAELRNKYSPSELLIWFQRAQNEISDEFEQRVESQDDAVRITTIHKCKGLTYKIVFAPYLDLKVKEYPIYEFREQGNYKYTFQPTDEQMELWREQIEQENRRLIYVALTRAQYKNYLCVNTSTSFSDSSIKNFPVSNQKSWNANQDVDVEDNQFANKEQLKFSPKPIREIEIKNTFGIHSFSALSKAHYTAQFIKENLNGNDNYDQFIFQTLGRGANVGTALHSIFERLNFAEPDTWGQTLTDASKYYSNILKDENREHMLKLIRHVMNAEININGQSFRLKAVKNDQKLPELEFCFSMSKVNKTVINELLDEEADLRGEADIEGLMTGFIDLLFQHDGKYYILDWKSNHLGNTTEDYNQNGMDLAMKGSNYRLQYMIYTLAAKRWLKSRIEDFDYSKHFGGVIYVFLRGVRQGQATGIYTACPEKKLIDQLDSKFRDEVLA